MLVASFVTNRPTMGDTRTYEDSVDIPIETPDYTYDFTHQVRNVTADPNSDFSDSVDATTGDQLEIKSVFTASVGIAENAKYTNTALDDNGDGYNNQDDKLSLKSGTVFVNGVLNPDAIQNGLFTKSFTPAGQSNTYIYRVIVNSSTEEIVRNSSTMENVKDVNNKILSIGPSDTISIRVHPPVPTTSFIEVPELIDFGGINSTGTEKMLTNKQTKGNLIVSHSAEPHIKF